jgi:CsoR family transcriptional regulator, copper-sensing transcriptional repressor
MRTPDSKHEALNRLSYIEGHLRGIRKMVEDDHYCVDVLKQSYAVRCAIEKFEAVLLRSHLAMCLPEGMRAGQSEELAGELEELFALSRRQFTGEERPSNGS